MASFGSTVTTIVSRITVAMLFPLNVRALLAAEGFTVCRLVHRMQHHRVHIAGALHVPEEVAVGRDASLWPYERQTNSARAGKGRSMAMSEKAKVMFSAVSTATLTTVL